jgi:asparagine synthase (glutamine-hydrolysing)
MCSILAVFGFQVGDDLGSLRRQALALSQRQRHRGPDANGIFADHDAILVSERLAIVDSARGGQPLHSPDGRLSLIINGEIYNHSSIKASLTQPYSFETGADGEVINALYGQVDDPGAWIPCLTGMFAFALWDRRDKRAIVARDAIGICPLYWGRDPAGRTWFASEMKALVGVCTDVAEFPPGHWYDSSTGEVRRYYFKVWRDYTSTVGGHVSSSDLREAFERAVERHMMADVSCGVLLSGGLDSSLVAAGVMRLAHARKARFYRVPPPWPQIDTFSIGLVGSPDLAAADRVAQALGTLHHRLVYTVQEGIDALPEVIRHIESYDTTTVRASIPMFIMARHIKALGIKAVLSGEGADEVFGGYLYFHKAPDARQFHEETVRKLDSLSKYDCLRANKAMAAWGVEARVPFLDTEFLDIAMSIDARAKMSGNGRMEKAILREAFDGWLPREILWRQKEQFSDGVGYAWIDGLKAYATKQISDAQFANAAARFPHNPPNTKEAYLYREYFERFFPGDACAITVPGGKSIACSSPTAIAWDAAFALAADPSGRSVVGVHQAAGDVAPLELTV